MFSSSAVTGLTDYFRSLLHGLWGDLVALDDRLAELDKQLKKIADSNEVTQRLQQLRGVGPLVATVGTGEQYKKGRQMAAALGLTPRQCSSGDKQRLLGNGCDFSLNLTRSWRRVTHAVCTLRPRRKVLSSHLDFIAFFFAIFLSAPMHADNKKQSQL